MENSSSVGLLIWQAFQKCSKIKSSTTYPLLTPKLPVALVPFLNAYTNTHTHKSYTQRYMHACNHFGSKVSHMCTFWVFYCSKNAQSFSSGMLSVPYAFTFLYPGNQLCAYILDHQKMSMVECVYDDCALILWVISLCSYAHTPF